jgi:hypothetical protein
MPITDEMMDNYKLSYVPSGIANSAQRGFSEHRAKKRQKQATPRLSGNCIAAWNIIEFAIQYFIIALRSNAVIVRKIK